MMIQPRASRPGVYAVLAVGVATVSTAAILIRLAQTALHPLAVAAWRLTLASLVLSPVALAARRSEMGRLARREWALVLLSGLLLALHFATWISSLALTSVAASVVLVTTNPLFVAAGAFLLLRERVSRTTVAALALATLGVVLIGLADADAGGHPLWGDVLALAGAVAAAGYLLIGRRLRARLSLLAYVYPVYAAAALVLLALALLAGVDLLPADPAAWLWLLLLALGPQVLGHSSLNWALGHLSAAYVALAIVGEPVLSTLLAWWLLGETPSEWVAFGGVLILAGIGVGSRAEKTDAEARKGEERTNAEAVP